MTILESRPSHGGPASLDNRPSEKETGLSSRARARDLGGRDGRNAEIPYGAQSEIRSRSNRRISGCAPYEAAAFLSSRPPGSLAHARDDSLRRHQRGHHVDAGPEVAD